MHRSYIGRLWRDRRHFKRESLMKTDTALLARMIETTRHFWGLGIAPLSAEDGPVRVDADQDAAAFPGGEIVDGNVIFA